jgi:hypothetical protein
MALLRSPDAVVAGEDRAAEALALLADPRSEDVLDADLVARHHDRTVEEVERLRETVAAAEGLETLEARFERRFAEARERVAALLGTSHENSWVATGRYANLLESHRQDFEDAARGTRAVRADARERLEALARWRDALRDLGPRAFRIRDRGVTRRGLASAATDARAGFDAAVAWLALRSDPNALDLVRARPVAVLGFLLLAFAAVVAVRRGRRLLDREIERRVASVPGLRHKGASPKEEKRDLAESVERREAAAKAAEETVVRQAAGDETAAPPPPPPPPAPPPAPAPPPQPPVGDAS